MNSPISPIPYKVLPHSKDTIALQINTTGGSEHEKILCCFTDGADVTYV